MKSPYKMILLVSILFSSFSASAAGSVLHTEDNEIVCQFNDFFRTRMFIDADTVLDKKVGLSTKVIEMSTQNAHGNTGRLFPVVILKVYRPTKDTQFILYRSTEDREMMNLLEVTPKRARMTTNVNQYGQPNDISFVAEARCQANEPH